MSKEIPKVKIFSEHKSRLGESPIFHFGRGSVFWLDILNQQLFEKLVGSETKDYDRSWKLPEVASALALDARSDHIIWMVTNKSFGYLDLRGDEYTAVAELNLAEGMRANDGGVGPDGQFWFGTMEFNPSGKHGSLYSVSPKGVIKNHNWEIGIPNTFCWSEPKRAFIMSDSLIQKTFYFEGAHGSSCEGGFEQKKHHILLDASPYGESTPDGGCVDAEGSLWIAMWGGAEIACVSGNGRRMRGIPVPVLQPTSCCFGGVNNNLLFVSSAYEGMTEKQYNQYPDSGKMFVIELPFRGVKVDKYKYLGGK